MPSDQPVTQWLNSDQVDLLRPWFVDRNEPNYAWQHACSAVMALPGLRAFWPMSSVDYTVASRARDVSGGGYHLSDNNTPLFGYDQLVPYVEFDGTNQYLSRADGGAANWADIIGTETYIAAAQRGLTIGGWFKFDALPAATNIFVMCKWGSVVGDRSYGIYHFGTTATFRVYDAAAAADTVTLAGALNTTDWLFFVGRFTPSVEVKVFVNDSSNTNVVGITAALDDNTSEFAIGARSGGASYMDGKASLCFLCASALSDSIIGALYQSTRKAFNA